MRETAFKYGMTTADAQAAQGRVRETVDKFHTLYDGYDDVIVGVSGGKDSTVMLECARIAAKERGHKVRAMFMDEELIPDRTIQYVERLADQPDIDLTWFCIPILENNALSREAPFWFPWDKDFEWHRPMPERAVTHMPGFKVGMGPAKAGTAWIESMAPRNAVQTIGVRSQESPARRMHANSHWIFKTSARPINDWTLHEVWRAILLNKWDWNRVYLDMFRAGHAWDSLRVSPFFGEEPSRDLWMLPLFAPEVWSAACSGRIADVETIARYALTALAGRGGDPTRKREDRTVAVTRQEIEAYLGSLPKEKRRTTAAAMKHLVKGYLKHRSQVHGGSVQSLLLRGDTKQKRRAISFVSDDSRESLRKKRRFYRNGKFIPSILKYEVRHIEYYKEQKARREARKAAVARRKAEKSRRRSGSRDTVSPKEQAGGEHIQPEQSHGSEHGPADRKP